MRSQRTILRVCFDVLALLGSARGSVDSAYSFLPCWGDYCFGQVAFGIISQARVHSIESVRRGSGSCFSVTLEMFVGFPIGFG
jgi:hypothetical protein